MNNSRQSSRQNWLFIVFSFSRTRTLFGVVLALSAFFMALPWSAQAAAHPDIVFIMLNDVGAGDLGAYGNRFVETPNLDELYKRSLRMENFHAYPTSGPTWAAALTGLWSEKTGVRRDYGGQQLVRKSSPLVSSVLADAGYQTAFLGRWPFGDNYPYRPQDRGFAISLVTGAGGLGQLGDYWGNASNNPILKYNGKLTKTKGRLTDTLFDFAIRTLNQPSNQPRFIVIAPNDAGEPFDVPAETFRHFSEKGVPPRQAAFYSQMALVDQAAGRLLKELYARKNTVILFSTNNGGIGGAVAGKYRGQKYDLTEGGHRVPFWVYYPEQVKPGKDLNKLAAAWDITPTILELADVPVPEKMELDGWSLVKAFRTDGESMPKRRLVIQLHRGEEFVEGSGAIVLDDPYDDEQMRLIEGKKLYNLSDDPLQEHDLSESKKGKINPLRMVYRNWLNEMKPYFDPRGDCPIILGHPSEPVAQLTCRDWHGLKDVPPIQKDLIKKPIVNGYWLVEIAVPGIYEFRLGLRPGYAGVPLPEGAAKLQITPVAYSAKAKQNDSRQEISKLGQLSGKQKQGSIVVELAKGRYKIQGWILDGNSRELRGAYYMEAEKK